MTAGQAAFSGVSPSDESIRSYLSAVRRFFAWRVQAADVDDMVQNVALRMATRVDDRKVENIDSYAFQVARSVMIDQRRRDQSRHMQQHQALEEWHHPVDELSPDRIAESRDELDLVLAELERLPERTRQAFILHRFEHLSYGNIAERMEISVSAVEKHIMRAIRKLNCVLDNDG